jgi:hypothetical protein
VSSAVAELGDQERPVVDQAGPYSSLAAILSTTPTSSRARPSIHALTDAGSPGSQ